MTLQEQVKSLMCELVKVKIDLDVLKRTIIESNKDSLCRQTEQRLQNNINDIAKGMLTRTKCIENSVKDIEARQDKFKNLYVDSKWDIQKELWEFSDKTTSRFECLRNLVLHFGDKMVIPKQSADDVFKYINDFVFSSEKDVNYDEVIKAKLAMKQIQTCGHYIQLHILCDAFEDTLSYNNKNDEIYAFEQLVAYIDALPNKKETPIQLASQDINNITLSHSNIVQEATTFYKNNNITNEDLMKTIQEMLRSQQYVLCESFHKTKINFDEANVSFLSVVAPHTLSQEDLHRLLFV